MTGQQPDPRGSNRYLLLGQIGMEMATPVALGVLGDYYLKTVPWFTIGGAVFGFVGGLLHLLSILKEEKDDRTPSSGQEP
jgi:F0F1-type ATP synthase assembly protein I